MKSDFRCNEIIHDVYDGIERTHELIKESKELSNEIEELEKDPNMDFNVYRKEEALKYLAFYKKHKGDFEICNIALTYPNNWILIDSVQTVFFINLNFKLLNIVNNIKNRRPNLEDEYPKIESLFTLYEENGDDKVLIELGHEIHRSLVDIDFMSKYWFSLLDYLGYDPMPIKLYIELFKKEYPDYENMFLEKSDGIIDCCFNFGLFFYMKFKGRCPGIAELFHRFCKTTPKEPAHPLICFLNYRLSNDT